MSTGIRLKSLHDNFEQDLIGVYSDLRKSIIHTRSCCGGHLIGIYGLNDGNINYALFKEQLTFVSTWKFGISHGVLILLGFHVRDLLEENVFVCA